MNETKAGWLAERDEVWVAELDWGEHPSGQYGFVRSRRRGRVARIDVCPRSALVIFDGTTDVSVLFPSDEGKSWWRTEENPDEDLPNQNPSFAWICSACGWCESADESGFGGFLAAGSPFPCPSCGHRVALAEDPR